MPTDRCSDGQKSDRRQAAFRIVSRSRAIKERCTWDETKLKCLRSYSMELANESSKRNDNESYWTANEDSMNVHPYSLEQWWCFVATSRQTTQRVPSKTRRDCPRILVIVSERASVPGLAKVAHHVGAGGRWSRQDDHVTAGRSRVPDERRVGTDGYRHVGRARDHAERAQGRQAQERHGRRGTDTQEAALTHEEQQRRGLRSRRKRRRRSSRG